MCNHVKKKNLNDFNFPNTINGSNVLSDPIQDDDVHHILYKI